MSRNKSDRFWVFINDCGSKIVISKNSVLYVRQAKNEDNYSIWLYGDRDGDELDVDVTRVGNPTFDELIEWLNTEV